MTDRAASCLLPAFAVAAVAGCALQTLDLNPGAPGNPGGAACAAYERVDPATGLCASCKVRTPPASDTCLCQVDFHASPFPYCEGTDVDYDCQPCTGDVSACAAYDAQTGTVRDCNRLQLCCAELVKSGSTCCLASGTLPYCVPSASTGLLEYKCCACQPACAPNEWCCVDCGCQCLPQAS